MKTRLHHVMSRIWFTNDYRPLLVLAFVLGALIVNGPIGGGGGA